MELLHSSSTPVQRSLNHAGPQSFALARNVGAPSTIQGPQALSVRTAPRVGRLDFEQQSRCRAQARQRTEHQFKTRGRSPITNTTYPKHFSSTFYRSTPNTKTSSARSKTTTCVCKPLR